MLAMEELCEEHLILGEDRQGGAAGGRFGHRYDPDARAEAQVSALRGSGARLMGSATLVGAVGAPRASKTGKLGLAFVPLWSYSVSDRLRLLEYMQNEAAAMGRVHGCLV